MIKLRLLYVFLIIMAVVVGCEINSESDLDNFPYVLFDEPVVKDDHAVFNARVYNSTLSDNYKFGFVWSGEPNPTVDDFMFLYDSIAIPETYRYMLYGGMKAGKRYFARACVITGESILYSNQASFISNGGREIEIDSISPMLGGPGTKVTIKGRYFPLNKNNIQVLVGESVAVIDTITENTIKFVIPNITKSIYLPVKLVSESGLLSSKEMLQVTYPFSKTDLLTFPPYRDDIIISANKFFSAASGSYVINQYHPLQFNLLNSVPTPEVITWDFKFALEPEKERVAALFSEKLYTFNMVDESWTYLSQLPDTGYQDFIFYNSQKICVGNIKSRKMYIYDLASQSWKNPVHIPQNLGTHSSGTYYNTEAAGYVYIRMNSEGTIAIFDLKNEEWQPKDDLIDSDVHVYDITSADGKLYFVTKKKSTYDRPWRFYDKELRILNEADYTWEKAITLPFDAYGQIFEYERKLHFLRAWERILWEYDPELH